MLLDEKYLTIKNILRSANLTQKDLARHIGVSEQHLSQVIRGVSQSRKVKSLVEKALDKKIWDEISLK